MRQATSYPFGPLQILFLLAEVSEELELFPYLSPDLFLSVFVGSKPIVWNTMNPENIASPISPFL